MAWVTIDEVAAAMRDGAMAVIPTDTVYGVAALPAAAAGIFELKQRSRDKALPVLGSGVVQLGEVAELDLTARLLAEKHWPGPLTLVVPRAKGFTADLGGTDPETVAVRVPAHPVALELLRRTGPLAVTSANVSGEPPATTYEAACALAPEILCLDGGTCDGVPSTVLGLVGEPVVFRDGGLDGRALIDSISRTEW